MTTQTPASRPRKAAYSVAETAALCGISRSRFYDLIQSGVMPHPTYCIRTRRPLYPADLAALCVRVRQTNVGFHGGYVLFYERPVTPAARVVPSEPSRTARKVAALDPLTQEMVETLKVMGLRASEADVLAAISGQCPSGVGEATFETDLRAIFDTLRCRSSA